MVFHIQHSPHYITTPKARSHNNIIENDEVDKLAKQGSLVDPIPSHWLLHPLLAASVPTSMQHDGSFRNLKHLYRKIIFKPNSLTCFNHVPLREEMVLQHKYPSSMV